MPSTRRPFHCIASILIGGMLLTGAPTAAASQMDVAEAVTTYLRQQAQHLPGEPRIAVDAASAARHPACSDIVPFLPAGTRLRARMSVGVRCDAPQAWTTFVRASVSVLGEQVVAARNLNMGETLTPDALSTREADLVTLAPGVVLHADEVLGAVATRRIPAGRPLRRDALRSADAVQRGQPVRLVVRGNGFVATGEGQALAAAAPGTMVQVRTGSGQTVSGVVRNATTVEVPL